jgi:hypothetical protein
MPAAQQEAEQANEAEGEKAALAAAIAVAEGGADAEGSASQVASEVPPQAAQQDAANLPWLPAMPGAAGWEANARENEASDGEYTLRPDGSEIPRGTQGAAHAFALDPVGARLPARAAATDALFASLSGHGGSFASWLQVYALPRNLVSLQHAIQTLLAECEDADAAIADWLLEPGVQPWLEWAAVAMIAGEAARRATGRQRKSRAADTEGQQLLHLFPELFGLAYGVR